MGIPDYLDYYMCSLKKVRKTLALGYEHLPFMLSWKLFVFVFNWGGIKVKIVLQEKLQEAILRLVTKFAP